MKKVLIKEIIETLESFAPLEWQEDYDNSGLTLGDFNNECSGVYVCLDISLEVVEKAIENKCNLIISHHPIIFGGIKKIDYCSTLGKIIVRAIKNDISIYSAHTNLDNAFNGVNGILAEKIGLQKFKPLSSDLIFNNDNYLGAGGIGELEEIMDTEDFLQMLKTNLNLSQIKFNSHKQKQIKKVAICGGSGSFLIDEAVKNKADVFITGEIKYHDLIDNDNIILLAEIGHFESEQFIKERIIAVLYEKFCNFVPLISDKTANRVKYIK